MKKILIVLGLLVIVGAGALWYSSKNKNHAVEEAAPASRSDTTLIQDSTIGTNKIENVTLITEDSAQQPIKHE